MVLRYCAPLLALSLTIPLTACETEDAELDAIDVLDDVEADADADADADEENTLEGLDALDLDASDRADDDDGDVRPGHADADALVLEIAPGEPVEIAEGITAIAPRPGEGVVMEVLYDDGVAYIADLETDAEGTVRLRLPDLGFADSGASRACASKCTDTSYKLLAHRWKKRVQWYYRDGGRPSSIGKTGAIGALKYAATTNTSSRNSCDMADQVSATHSYKGTTGTAPNISGTANSVACNTSDGKNVVGWGSDLPNSTLGVACTWRIGDEAVETDQKYNSKKKWFGGNSAPSGCTDKVSLRAVASHEWGHSYGLDHTGCKQTMAPSTKVCNSSARLLGKGDVRGLRKLY